MFPHWWHLELDPIWVITKSNVLLHDFVPLCIYYSLEWICRKKEGKEALNFNNQGQITFHNACSYLSSCQGICKVLISNHHHQQWLLQCWMTFVMLMEHFSFSVNFLLMYPVHIFHSNVCLFLLDLYELSMLGISIFFIKVYSFLTLIISQQIGIKWKSTIMSIISEIGNITLLFFIITLSSF